MAVFEELVEEHLDQPTFVLEAPGRDLAARQADPDDPRFVERFELYIGGMEIANAFSELNDPDVQAERFRQQLAAARPATRRRTGFDEDYVRALEHGMPPAGGEGSASTGW
jgi:lysyl-tRNA synthetase, class II